MNAQVTTTDNVTDQVRRMLNVGTPIIVIDSYDHPHTVERLKPRVDERPAIGWNAADGFYAINELGEDALDRLDPADTKMAQQGPHAAIHVAMKFCEGTVLLIDNLHWYWDKPPVMQALLNAREPFKATRRAIIALTLQCSIPADLQQSISFIDDPLPSEEMLMAKVKQVYTSALGPDAVLDDVEAIKVARELRGTSTFKAEQLAFQSLTKQGIDRVRVRSNMDKQINDTVGLSVEHGSETFDDIGGQTAIKGFLTRYFNGPRKATVVVRVEEMEKALAGAGTDSSGSSGKLLGTILTAMEDYRWNGILAYGPPGAGKSLLSKGCGNEFGAKALRLDMARLEGGLVGQTAQQGEACVKMLHAIGGERVFFIASMNEVSSLPSALRRRFSAGTWFFDVPDAAGRKAIWDIQAKAFDVEYDGYDADMLTGADIRDIVQRSYELGCTTREAAAYHVPLCKASPDTITQSRDEATNRYLDANAGGPYRDPTKVATQYNRSIELND